MSEDIGDYLDIKLPKDFYFGASTSSHQVEGNNNNDWSEWEKLHCQELAYKAGPTKNYGNGKYSLPDWAKIAPEATNPTNYLSGSAVDHYHHWQEDIDLASSLGMNALRYSIEWSRVQPNSTTFDNTVIDHYRQVSEYCLEKGIKPFITLHHFTNPKWIAKNGGWETPETVLSFNRFVAKIADSLVSGEGINYLVFNEPNVYAGLGWILGQWPPNKHNPVAYAKVKKNLIEAHKNSYDILKSKDDSSLVSSAVNYIHFDQSENTTNPLNQALSWVGKKQFNEWFNVKTLDQQDFISLNHYMHCVVNGGFYKNATDEPRSDLGWYLNPNSLLEVLKEVKKYNKPIIISENGLADSQDRYRAWFIANSLRSISNARKEGIDVRGYLHWSLLDNFEWAQGYWPKFGLIEVDRQTMERHPRPSAYFYQLLIEQSKK